MLLKCKDPERQERLLVHGYPGRVKSSVLDSKLESWQLSGQRLNGNSKTPAALESLIFFCCTYLGVQNT